MYYVPCATYYGWLGAPYQCQMPMCSEHCAPYQCQRGSTTGSWQISALLPWTAPTSKMPPPPFFWFCQDLAHADVTCQYCFLQLHGMAWHATWEQVMFPCGMSLLQVIHNRFNLFGYFELATVSTFYFWGNIKFWKKRFCVNIML